jgi:hypothetical protein
MRVASILDEILVGHSFSLDDIFPNNNTRNLGEPSEYVPGVS